MKLLPRVTIGTYSNGDITSRKDLDMLCEQILQSKLTHREIQSLVGGEAVMSRRKISAARSGHPQHREMLLNLLKGLNQNMLQGKWKDAKLVEQVDLLIKKAERLLRMKPVDPRGNVNTEYLREYKEYIDMKVIYNKLKVEARNHSTLIRLHQSVRTQHEEIKKLSKVSA